MRIDQNKERGKDLNQNIKDKKFSGIIRELGTLPEYTVIYESALARILNRHKVSIKRAVERGELPPGVKMFGEQAWTVKAIREHISQRLVKAAQDIEKLNLRMDRLGA
ncbi:hypothetical protein ACFL6U_12965 [Planctomycetota bacterium]